MQKHGRLSVTVFCSTVFLISVSTLFGQSNDQDEFAIAGGRFTQLGDTVFISYRLVAPEDETIQVSVLLRKGEDTTFAIVPVSVNGAIGSVRGGGDKLILWNYKNDVPPDFQFGADYWFQFEGTLVHQGFAPKWWHYALGGGLIAAAAVLVGSGADEKTPVSPYSLPDPPGIRPPEE